MEPSLLTVTQAAALRGDVTDHTIRRWLRLGWLPATKYGKTWLVDKTAVLEFTPPRCGRRGSNELAR